MTDPRRTAIVLLELLLLFLITASTPCSALSLVMMGSRRRGKGGLKRSLADPASVSSSGALNKNVGLGQEITGVTLPADGTIKGWEFGQGVRLVCANVDDTFYALQGQCPRCGFDLYKGDLIAEDNAGWEDLPRVACPTCATTYSLQTGVHGPPIKRSGISNWVSGLAKTATQGDEYKDAKAFAIARDQDGRVYLREK